MQPITSAQLRAARAILKITAQELADAAGVGVATVRRAEDDIAGQSTSRVVSQALRLALENMGVEFIVAQDGTESVSWNPIQDHDFEPA